MTTAVQRRRGTSTEHATFTGLDGEITVNTTTYTLHIHDGATVGGIALAKADGSNISTSSIDINGGTIDGTVIGGSSAAAGSFTSITGTSANINGTVTADGLTVDGNASIGTSGTSVLDFERSGANYIRANNSGTGRLHLGAGGDLRFHTGQADNDFTENERIRIASNGDISFYDDTGVSQSFYWDASAESLGIGTASPAFYQGSGLEIERAGIATVRLQNTTTGKSAELKIDTDVTLETINTGSSLLFNTAATERARLDASGNWLVGKTSSSFTADGIEARADGQLWVTDTSGSPLFLSRKTTDGAIATFCKEAATVGSISVTGSATAYNTSSDYRLKENVVPMDDASSRVLALKPCRFNFIADPEKTVDGFIAHEAQEVVPEAVHGTKDAMRTEEYEVSPAVYEDVIIPAVTEERLVSEAVLDEDGNELEPAVYETVEVSPERTEQKLVSEAVMGTREVPEYQGIDQSKLVPLLTAALQEALKRIEALEAQVGV